MDIIEKERLETFKSLAVLASLALKALLLLNGGAAIALLAFLGNIWGNAELPKVGPSMIWFVIGLTAAGGATMGAYLTQLHLYNERRDDTNPLYWSSHQPKLHTSIMLTILSLGAFCVGAILAVGAFHNS